MKLSSRIAVGIGLLIAPALPSNAATLMLSDGSAYFNDFASGIGNLTNNTAPNGDAIAARSTTMGSGDNTSFHIVSTGTTWASQKNNTALDASLSLYVIQFDFRPLESGTSPGFNSMYLFRPGVTGGDALFGLAATDEAGGETYKITAGALSVSGLSVTEWTRFVIQRTTTATNTNAYTLWTGALQSDGETWVYTERGQFSALNANPIAGFLFGDAVSSGSLQNGQGYWDNISIGTPIPIPEPAALLFAACVGALTWAGRRKSKETLS